MKAKRKPTISSIYFDLGWVLLPLKKKETAQKLSAVSALSSGVIYKIIVDDEIDGKYDKSFWNIVLDFDRGKIYPHEFYERVSERLLLTVGFDEFVKIWQSMLTVDQSMLAIIMELRKRGIRTGAISDLCHIHYKYFLELGLRDFFDILFISFLEERLKREDDGITFAKAIAAAGPNLSPRNILFTDDRPVNIAAAKRWGLSTHLFTTPAKFLKCLRRYGIKLN